MDFNQRKQTNAFMLNFECPIHEVGFLLEWKSNEIGRTGASLFIEKTTLNV